MVDKQTPTPIKTNNTTELGLVKNNVKKKLILTDIRFQWLGCQNIQGRFRHFWEPGTTNKGNCVTEHRLGIHHRVIRPEFLTPKCQLKNPEEMCKADKIRSKGVLDKSYVTDSQREHCGDIRKSARNSRTYKYVTASAW